MKRGPVWVGCWGTCATPAARLQLGRLRERVDEQPERRLAKLGVPSRADEGQHRPQRGGQLARLGHELRHVAQDGHREPPQLGKSKSSKASSKGFDMQTGPPPGPSFVPWIQLVPTFVYSASVPFFARAIARPVLTTGSESR